MNLLLTAVGGAGDDRKCVINYDQVRFVTTATGPDSNVTVLYFDSTDYYVNVRETVEIIFAMLSKEK